MHGRQFGSFARILLTATQIESTMRGREREGGREGERER